MADSKKDETPQGNDNDHGNSPVQPTTLEQARKFLSDENVQSATQEKKAEFLKGKGFTDKDVQRLFSEDTSKQDADVNHGGNQPEAAAAQQTPLGDETQAAPSSSPSAGPSVTPPIITYPEFLTHSPKPPPLLTPTRLLNAATALTTAWTLAYGAARFIINPMVESLSDSRADYYDHINTKLSTLVDKLEGVVSEVPYKNGKPLKSDAENDDDSSYGDPTEMFHRDIGTQTSPQELVVLTPESSDKTIDQQALRLAQLTSSLKELSDTYVSQAENSGNLHLSLREFREDVDKLAYPSGSEYSTMYGGSGFGIGRSSEPEDEIKNTKDAIRSIKGMFLSSRMFPAAAAAR